MSGPQSRLEKYGTIFTRVRGLLNNGALEPKNKPLWFDVYAAHPPSVEPTMNRPKPTQPPINIIYVEDYIRAKFHKTYGDVGGAIDLTDNRRYSISQRFVNKCMELEKSTPDKSKLFQIVEDQLKLEGLDLVSLASRKKVRRESQDVEKQQMRPRGERRLDALAAEHESDVPVDEFDRVDETLVSEPFKMSISEAFLKATRASAQEKRDTSKRSSTGDQTEEK